MHFFIILIQENLNNYIQLSKELWVKIILIVMIF